jgi:hypothetical protein
MAHPLELAYNWRTPALFASVGAVVCVGIVLRGSAEGRWGVAAVLMVLWALCLALVWARTRVRLIVDGPRLTVRRLRTWHTVDAPELVRVRQRPGAAGPSYLLVTRDAGGTEHRVLVPVALLRGGYPTLLGWILAHAPQAELDRGSHRTLDRLRQGGLLP